MIQLVYTYLGQNLTNSIKGMILEDKLWPKKAQGFLFKLKSKNSDGSFRADGGNYVKEGQ